MPLLPLLGPQGGGGGGGAGGGLDTRNKRGSAIGFNRSYVRIFPNPDGGLSQADRQQVAYTYQGILAEGGGGQQGGEAQNNYPKFTMEFMNIF
jgi:hypothetical protein